MDSHAGATGLHGVRGWELMSEDLIKIRSRWMLGGYDLILDKILKLVVGATLTRHFEHEFCCNSSALKISVCFRNNFDLELEWCAKRIEERDRRCA